MSVDEIFESAKRASKLGCKTIVLQSGEDENYPIKRICGIIRRIKQELDCALTLSIGERSYEEYKILKEAGADRYLLKFETSSKELYKKLKPTSDYNKRLIYLSWLKELKYQVGAGNLIGLPGQTEKDIAQDLLLMRELDLDMISVSPFIPHPQTPLRLAPAGVSKITLKAIALTRLLTKRAHIPATTALKTVDFKSWKQALNCGANVIMVNVTPSPYRKYYEIYPGISEVDDSCMSNKKEIEDIIVFSGKTVAKGYGHSLQ